MIHAIVIGVLLFSQALLGKEDISQFKFAYKYDKKGNKTYPCAILQKSDYKKIHDCKIDKPSKECPECEVDKNIRRCQIDKKIAVNIFFTKDQCVVSRQQAIEAW